MSTQQERNDEQQLTGIHLSDDDVNRIVDKVCEQIENRLYNNVGQGIVSLVWRGVLLAVIALAAYGVAGQIHWFK